MRCRKFDSAKPLRSRASAFSLVELLAVILIISIMIAMLAPSIGSFSSVAGRKGAVNILMNTLEQARAAALETGCDVHVLLWQREYPKRDAIMVLRSPSLWNNETDAQALTKWIPLPEGVLLHKPQKGANVFSSGAGAPTGVFPSSYWAAMPGTDFDKPRREEIAIVTFNASGSIRFPSAENARVIVSEGVRDKAGVEALIGRKGSSSSGFDVITMSRFTGRAQLDVSTL